MLECLRSYKKRKKLFITLLFIFLITSSILKAEKPVIDSVTISPSPACTHQTVSYSAIGHDPDGGCSGGIKSWFWDFGDGSNSGWISGGTTHKYTSYSPPDGYVVTVYACDYNNEISESEQRNLIIIQAKIDSAGHLFPTDKYDKVIIIASFTAGPTGGNLTTSVKPGEYEPITPKEITIHHNNTSETHYVDHFGVFEGEGSVLGALFWISSIYTRSDCVDGRVYEVSQ